MESTWNFKAASMSADLPPYTHMNTMLSQYTTRSGVVSALLVMQSVFVISLKQFAKHYRNSSVVDVCPRHYQRSDYVRVALIGGDAQSGEIREDLQRH
jgi:hypothetical protein